MNRAEVLIVGGGPAGASTAFALASAGVDVHLVDRAHFPRPKPCAESLSPEASRILAAMGALEPIEQSGAAMLTGVRVRSPSGVIIAGDFVAKHGYRGFRDRALSVRREVLDAILLERARAAGARVTEGIRVTDVLSNAGRTTGVTTLRGDLHAKFVVAADGLRSVIARRLGLARSFARPRRLALVTHYAGVRDVGEHVEMHVERGGYVGIADVGHGLTTVALVVPVRHAREISLDRAAFVDDWLRSKPHLATRFANAERATPVVATGPFASHARRLTAPGVALVGDAADFFDPFTGEGIYSALRGGELLAASVRDALAASTLADADRALAGYEIAHRRAFAGKRTVERVVGAIVDSPALMNHVARRLAARKDLADLLIGVTGDFVPAREVIRARYLWGVLRTPWVGSRD